MRPFYQKALLVNGELARGMYSRGVACDSIELVKQTTIINERQGATEPIDGKTRKVAILEIVDGDERIVEIL